MMKFAKSLIRPVASGQALSEMGLLLSLVGVVSIGGLLYYSNQLSGLYGGYGFGNNNTVASTGGIGAGSTGGSGTTGSSTGGSGTTTGTGSTSTVNPGDAYFMMPDGTQVNLSKYQPNLQSAVETTGVNGATDMLASTIESLAQSLVDQGKITPEQAANLVDLANKAHNVAATQKFIEDMINTPGMTAQTLQSTPVVFNGGTYANVWSVAMGQIGMCENSVAGNCAADSTEYGGPSGIPLTQTSYDGNYWGQDMAAFHQAYQTVLSSGTLNDPTVSNFVSQLVNNVSTLGDTFEYNVLTTVDPGFTTDNSQITGFAQNVASSITNNNGVAICTAGTGTDTGTNCQ